MFIQTSKKWRLLRYWIYNGRCTEGPEGWFEWFLLKRCYSTQWCYLDMFQIALWHTFSNFCYRWEQHFVLQVCLCRIQCNNRKLIFSTGSTDTSKVHSPHSIFKLIKWDLNWQILSFKLATNVRTKAVWKCQVKVRCYQSYRFANFQIVPHLAAVSA